MAQIPSLLVVEAAGLLISARHLRHGGCVLRAGLSVSCATKRAVRGCGFLPVPARCRDQPDDGLSVHRRAGIRNTTCIDASSLSLAKLVSSVALSRTRCVRQLCVVGAGYGGLLVTSCSCAVFPWYSDSNFRSSYCDHKPRESLFHL